MSSNDSNRSRSGSYIPICFVSCSWCPGEVLQANVSEIETTTVNEFLSQLQWANSWWNPMIRNYSKVYMGGKCYRLKEKGEACLSVVSRLVSRTYPGMCRILFGDQIMKPFFVDNKPFIHIELIVRRGKWVHFDPETNPVIDWSADIEPQTKVTPNEKHASRKLKSNADDWIWNQELEPRPETDWTESPAKRYKIDWNLWERAGAASVEVHQNTASSSRKNKLAVSQAASGRNSNKKHNHSAKFRKEKELKTAGVAGEKKEEELPEPETSPQATSDDMEIEIAKPSKNGAPRTCEEVDATAADTVVDESENGDEEEANSDSSSSASSESAVQSLKLKEQNKQKQDEESNCSWGDFDDDDDDEKQTQTAASKAPLASKAEDTSEAMPANDDKEEPPSEKEIPQQQQPSAVVGKGNEAPKQAEKRNPQSARKEALTEDTGEKADPAATVDKVISTKDEVDSDDLSSSSSSSSAASLEEEKNEQHQKDEESVCSWGDFDDDDDKEKKATTRPTKSTPRSKSEKSTVSSSADKNEKISEQRDTRLKNNKQPEKTVLKNRDAEASTGMTTPPVKEIFVSDDSMEKEEQHHAGGEKQDIERECGRTVEAEAKGDKQEDDVDMQSVSSASSSTSSSSSSSATSSSSVTTLAGKNGDVKKVVEVKTPAKPISGRRNSSVRRRRTPLLSMGKKIVIDTKQLH